MDKFLEVFLPEGILEWFEIKEVEKDEKVVRIIFEEKNIVPTIPGEHAGKRIVSKGFSKLIVDDFGIRGKKGELIFMRRSWEIEGSNHLLKRDIQICFPGTKLEKEFASFLKELSRE
ncbi:MAG: hypothetical protein GW809_07655 [Bacteroidetes bacterium]|nr:hypothetical protein [Bacteroidota bacterium]